MSDYSHHLSTLSAQQNHTIACYALENGETVWLRKTGKHLPQWRYKLLGWIASLLKLGALHPVPNFGGRIALQTEAERLKQLHRQGVCVPPLLAQSDDALLFGHIGNHTLLSEIEHGGNPLQSWQQGLDAIAEVHAKGAYLSQAFARNIIRTDNGGIGFIDFEDNPADYLDFSLCCSRDWLCYLHSTAIVLNAHGLLEEAAIIWKQLSDTLPENTAGAIAAAAHKTLWLRHFSSPKLGRDTLRLACLSKLFFLASRHRPTESEPS